MGAACGGGRRRDPAEGAPVSVPAPRALGQRWLVVAALVSALAAAARPAPSAPGPARSDADTAAIPWRFDTGG